MFWLYCIQYNMSNVFKMDLRSMPIFKPCCSYPEVFKLNDMELILKRAT